MNHLISFRLLGLTIVLAGLSACECSPAIVNTDGGRRYDGGPLLDASYTFVTDAGPFIDPNDPRNPSKDTDCDGLNDAEEFGNTYPGGARTNPADPDSDDDGLFDGLEAGRLTSVDPSCVYAGDADPSSRTNPTQRDSDGDGLGDGIEDADHDGLADPLETDATNPDTDFDGLLDGAEDANANGLVEATETDPRKKDTDGDFINDALEIKVTLTDPTKPDTDGDTCRDGAEDLNRNGVVDPGESNPRLAGDCGAATNPDTDGDGLVNAVEDKNHNGVVDPGETNANKADTDGDGLNDGVEDANKNGFFEAGETNPTRVDTDCDGLLDGPATTSFKGEDQNANGVVDTGETDPRRRDTDGDGISDGVELGNTAVPDMASCGPILVDVDPGTTTKPGDRDTDGDGIDDGAEDTNQNGKVDPGELDPNDPSDGMGPAGKVCTQANLKPVTFTAQGTPDVQLGLPASFTEIAPMEVGGQTRGIIGYDPTNRVAFIAWRQSALNGATTPIDDEAQIRPLLNAVGALDNQTTQQFTSWDTVAAVQAFYDMAGGGDLKTRANAIANALVGGGAGALTGSASATGPFKLQVEYLHRTNSAVVVVVAVTTMARYTGTPVFVMTDTAGGSAVAQFGDANAYQCETFRPSAGKVDFLFVVDDSCSMAGSQTFLARAATAMTDALANSTIDARLGLVTTSYHQPGSGPNAGVIRGFTSDVAEFQQWLDYDPRCDFVNPRCDAGNFCRGSTDKWIGLCGTGSEGMLGSARRGTDDITQAVAAQKAKLRPDAQLVLVMMGDADDQTTDYDETDTPIMPDGGPRVYELIENFKQFFTASDGGTYAANTRNKLDMLIPTHGIVCPTGTSCNGEFQASPQRHAQVIVATGAVRGAINSSASISAAINAIVNSTIAAGGYRMQKPPIGASVKLALDAVQNPALCNKDDLPRSTVNGFDFNGVTRTISLFGACRPGVAIGSAAVSYRYWADTTPNPGGSPAPCSTDSSYDPTDPDFCLGALECNLETQTCECPADCGGGVPPGKVCDTNKLVCAAVCTPDCNGTCSPYQQCNTTSCGCECKQSASCPVGFKFENSGGTCGCVCDTAGLNCGSTYSADPSACACVCKPDCGGCPTGTTCNASTCACGDGIN